MALCMAMQCPSSSMKTVPVGKGGTGMKALTLTPMGPLLFKAGAIPPA